MCSSTDLSIGKQWHALKSAFRPKAGQSTYARRTEERISRAVTKAKEKEMKDTKEAERQVYSYKKVISLVKDGY